MAAANLYGQIYGIKGTTDCASIRKTLEKVSVPSFTPKSSVKIHLTDKDMEEDKKQDSDDAGELFECHYIFNVTTHCLEEFLFFMSLFVHATEKARLEELKGKLASPSLKSSAMQMYPTDFEKVGWEHSDTSAACSAEAETDWRLSVSRELHSELWVLSEYDFLSPRLWVLSDPNLCFCSKHS